MFPHARAEAKNVLDNSLVQEEKSVASISNFYSSDRVDSFLGWIRTNLRNQHDAVLDHVNNVSKKFVPGMNEPPPLEARPDTRVPVRLTRGPLDFGLPESKLDSGSAAWYHLKEFKLNGDERFELVNFVDGKRTVSEIQNALSAEFEPIETGVVSHYIDDLVKVGVMGWKE